MPLLHFTCVVRQLGGRSFKKPRADYIPINVFLLWIATQQLTVFLTSALFPDKFKTPERPVTKPFRLSVNDVFKGLGSGFCVSGKIETGMLQTGDKVLIQPVGETATIKGL